MVTWTSISIACFNQWKSTAACPLEFFVGLQLTFLGTFAPAAGFTTGFNIPLTPQAIYYFYFKELIGWLFTWLVIVKFDNSYHQNIFANIITWRKRMRISCFGCANIRYNNFAFFYPRKKNINIWILLRYRNIF